MFLQTFQDSVHIYIHQQRNHMILYQLMQKHPVIINIFWPVFSSEVIQKWNLVPYHCHRHYHLWPQVFGQHSPQVINHWIFHYYSLLSFHFGSTFQNIIQVKFHIWFPVQVQGFGQHGTQLSNCQICNHFIILGFWPIFLLEIPVNIQKFYQVLFQSLQPYEITHHVPSG